MLGVYLVNFYQYILHVTTLTWFSPTKFMNDMISFVAKPGVQSSHTNRRIYAFCSFCFLFFFCDGSDLLN